MLIGFVSHVVDINCNLKQISRISQHANRRIEQ